MLLGFDIGPRYAVQENIGSFRSENFQGTEIVSRTHISHTGVAAVSVNWLVIPHFPS